MARKRRTDVRFALGIGANSAIFALAGATFFRPLPFTQPPPLS